MSAAHARRAYCLPVKENNPAFAQMIHNTDLATWLVRVAGKVLGLLLIWPLLAAMLAAALSEPGFVALGVFASTLHVLLYLNGAVVPMPSEYTVGVLEDDDDDG